MDLRQAEKAVTSLEGCREGYSTQGYDVRDLPAPVKNGMDVIKDVNTQKMTPAEADARLREMGYDGLPGFMERISGQFSSFGWMRKG